MSWEEKDIGPDFGEKRTSDENYYRDCCRDFKRKRKIQSWEREEEMDLRQTFELSLGAEQQVTRGSDDGRRTRNSRNMAR